jgi:hypothetical protein
VFTLKTIFFSRTSRPISIKFSTNYPWLKRIKDCSKEGQVLFQGELILEIQK